MKTILSNQKRGRLFGDSEINTNMLRTYINHTRNNYFMKKIFLPIIGASLITMFSAFSSYDNEEEYDNDIVSDTIVNDTTNTFKIIKDKEPEEWAD